jgi:hypothetical protein
MNSDKQVGLIYREECFAIIGACFEVYNEKGCGFTEPIYQECLEIELDLRGIQFQAQAHLPLSYKQHPCGNGSNRTSFAWTRSSSRSRRWRR